MIIRAALLFSQAAVISGGLWLDVPFVRQDKNGCGSAVVWMVMQYWRKASTPPVAEIHRELYWEEAHGIYARDMERYLNRHAFQTFAFEAAWDDLVAHISKGRPLIVCLERNARGVPLHYVVVAGIDRDQDLVWLNDPAERKLLPMRRAEFEKQWSAMGNWTLLTLPESESIEVDTPRPAEAVLDQSELAMASSAFRAEHFTEAEKHLKSVLRIHPADHFVNDFLGTTYLLDGNFDAALKYWSRAGKPRVREIHIDPPLQIEAILLDHTFAFSRASLLTPAAYGETRRRLDSLGVFSRYEFELTPTDIGDFDLTLRASERHGPNFVSWIRGLLYQTVYPAWWNAGGRAINLESQIRWDRDNRRGWMSLSSPLRQNSSLTYRLQLDTRNENWLRGGQTFNLRRTQLSGDVHAIFKGGWNATSGVAVARRAFTNSFAGGTSITYKASVQRTVLTLPEKRLTLDWSASAQLGKLFAQPSERFVKTQEDVSLQWFPFSQRRNDYETKARLRLGKSFGRLPFDDLFILGLDRDSDLQLRGHPAIQSGRKGAAPMGRAYALMNAEFAKRLYANGLFRLDGVPFLDTARISSHAQWLVDSGIQLRVSVLSAFTISVSLGRDLRTGQHAILIDSMRD